MKQLTPNNITIREQRIQTRKNILTPTEGDIIILPFFHKKLPTHTRITLIGEDIIQTGKNGDFFIGKNGYCSYSGSLNPGIKPEDLLPTEEWMDESCWFPNNDILEAGSAIYTKIPFRVWKLKETTNLQGLWELHTGYFLVHDQRKDSEYEFLISHQGCSHAAFETQSQFETWLKVHTLELTKPIEKSQRLEYCGTKRQSSNDLTP